MSSNLGNQQLGDIVLGLEFSDEVAIVGHGQAQAWIKTTYNAHGQSQGQIKQTYYGLGQAQGLIQSFKTAHGQAQALITGQYYQLLDTFSRTFGPFTGSHPTISVDTVNPPDKGKYSYIAFFNAFEATGSRLESESAEDTLLESIVNSSDITGSIDFYSDTYGQEFYVEIYFDNEFGKFVYAHYYLDVGIESTLTLEFDDDLVDTSFPTIEDGEAYRLLFHMGNGLFKTKLWKLSEPEPTAWSLQVEHAAFFATRASFYFDPPNTSTLVWLDNLSFLVPQPPIAQGYGQAVAYILGATTVHGQARARIKSEGVNRFGQAQAFIQKLAGYGQALALIVRTESKHGQAQATIRVPGISLAQAQARIHRYELYGQAAGTIEQTYSTVAQANAYIIQHHRWFGQAQARIIQGASYGRGQAQALISNPMGHGQARAVITGGVNYLVLDTASRITSLGSLGTPDIGPAYTLGAYEYDYSLVDGSNIVTTGTVDYDYIWANVYVNARDVELYIDFQVDTLNDWQTVIELRGRQSVIGAGIGPSVYMYYSPEDSNMVISGGFIENSPTDETYPTITPSVWYTARLSLQGSAVKFRVWERDDPEPVTWDYERTIGSLWAYQDYGGVGFYSDVGENFTPPTEIRHDNFMAIGLEQPTYYGLGQARAAIIKGVRRPTGQAQALIGYRFSGHGQAQARITGRGTKHGQAQALIMKPQQFGQAQAYIKGTITSRVGQAQALVASPQNASGQARAYIVKPQCFGQAQAQIVAFGTIKRGNAQALIKKTSVSKSGQAQGFILTKGGPAFGQAAALIAGKKYLTRYHNYDLPGYAQAEQVSSVQELFDDKAPYEDGSFAEYIGLRNKILSLQMRVVGTTYADVRVQARRAGTMLHSSRGFSKLYVQNYDRYYVAQTNQVNFGKVVGESMRLLDYSIEFETKPWLVSDATYTISGVGTIDTDVVARDIDSGGWSPTRIRVDGTNVTISGYSLAGDLTGFISISGAVTGLLLDSENYTATLNGQRADNVLFTPNYATYVAPGKTIFVINGATACEISWNNRWYL